MISIPNEDNISTSLVLQRRKRILSKETCILNVLHKYINRIEFQLGKFLYRLLNYICLI